MSAGRRREPRPLAEAPRARLARVRGICFDIDDTFSTEGKIRPVAYAALWRAHRAGLGLAAVTGRPAGWCDHLARMWPIDAVVGENGAFYFAHDAQARRLVRRYVQSEAERAEGRVRLERAREAVLAAVPGARISADQPFRIADLAVDFAEDVGPLPDADIDRIVEVLEAHGATCKVSSIHVNAYFGRYDKRGMLLELARERWGLSADAAARSLAYVGDSPNDEPLFAAFELSVGVANVRPMLPRMAHPPRYVTRGKGGAGFAELVRAILAARAPNRG
ncbi:MAG: HAD hydrolase family protein [Deltaproteobacteria bacterium]|nr:HAD hydrolase family protein [Deltaproteobacteria bacterium]